MNLDFDLESHGLHSGRHLDWHGLRARLAAGYAARTVLEQAERRDPAEGGSFDRSSARVLARYGVIPGADWEGVNPTALADRNPGHDNDADVTTNVAGD